MKNKIMRNAAKCRLCGDILESKKMYENYKKRLCTKAKEILQYPEKKLQIGRISRISKKWLDRFERAKNKTKE